MRRAPSQKQARQVFEAYKAQPSMMIRQPRSTIQSKCLGDPQPKIERFIIELPKPKPGPKTTRQERRAALQEKLIGLQLNKQGRAIRRKLRQLSNREKRPDDPYTPKAV